MSDSVQAWLHPLSWVMVLLGIGSGVVVAVDISRCAPQPNIENRIKVSVLQALDERDCRLLALDTQQELSLHIRFTLGFDECSLAAVQHPDTKAHFLGQPVDERTEAHTLHGAADDDPHTLNLLQSHLPRLTVAVTGACDAYPLPLVFPSRPAVSLAPAHSGKLPPLCR